MLASLLAVSPVPLDVLTSSLVGGAMLFTALLFLEQGTRPFGWRPSWVRAEDDDSDGCYGAAQPCPEHATLSGRWIGIQLFGPGVHDYFAWTLSLTQRGTSLDGEVQLQMATAAGGLVSAAGRVVVRGTVVGETVTMTLLTPHARRGPSAPYRLTLGADGRAMVGTAMVSAQSPGYLISLVRR